LHRVGRTQIGLECGRLTLDPRLSEASYEGETAIDAGEGVAAPESESVSGRVFAAAAGKVVGSADSTCQAANYDASSGKIGIAVIRT